MPSTPERRVGRLAPPLDGGAGLAWLSLATFSILWVARSPGFPVGIDPLYHLLVARQVVEAGGPFLYETWQYAPVGRPHLYPPVLHLILAGLLKLGCPPVIALQTLTALLLPALCASIYLVMRRLISPTAGLAALGMALLPFAWMIQVAGALASGLALLELLWFMVAVKERRAAAAAGLLSLMFYTHLGLSWVAVASLIWWAVLRAVPRDRAVPIILGLGLLVAAPWLGHIASHAPQLHVSGRQENHLLDLLPVLYGLAAYGAWRAWTQGGSTRLLLGLWLGFSLMAPAFTFRWVSGEGLLPVILLAGYGLASWMDRITWRTPRWAGWAAVGAGLLLAPSMLVQDSQVRMVWLDAAPFHLLNAPRTAPKAMEVQLHTPPTMRLARAVAAAARPGEILWSNAAYAGGFVAALAGRPTSSAMFYEVPPARPFDPVEAAHWVIWFNVAPMPGVPSLQSLVSRYHLTVAGEGSLAVLLHNPAARQLAQVPRAFIPWWPAFMLLCMLLGFIVLNFRKDTWPE